MTLKTEPTHTPTTAIVLGTYNRLGQLQNCLNSFLGKLSHPTRVVVIDAGSTDGAREYLKSLSGVELIFESERIGQAKSYNNAFRKLDTDFIAWISDDNIVLPEVLDEAIETLARVRRLGALALKVKDVSGPFVKAAYIGGISSKGVLNVNQGLVRRSVFEEVGYFSEDLIDYGIDPDLTAKILGAGYTVAYTKKICILHDRQWSLNSSSDEYARKMERMRASLDVYERRHVALDQTPPHWSQPLKRLLPPYNLLDRVRRFLPRRTASADPTAAAGAPEMSYRETLFEKGLGALPLAGEAFKRVRRDWRNIKYTRFISILDPLIHWGQPFHLEQDLGLARAGRRSRAAKEDAPQ
jgi:GT2 family glycosyltransferase